MAKITTSDGLTYDLLSTKAAHNVYQKWRRGERVLFCDLPKRVQRTTLEALLNDSLFSRLLPLTVAGQPEYDNLILSFLDGLHGRIFVLLKIRGFGRKSLDLISDFMESNGLRRLDGRTLAKSRFNNGR